MGGVKKGMLFVLSVCLLATAFLYILSVISLYSNSIKITATSLSDIERLNAQSDALAYQMKSILLSGAVGLTVAEAEGFTVVSLEETVPMPASYPNDIMNFKDFAETRTRLNTSINITEAWRPKMYVDPYNLVIDHPVGKLVVEPEESTESSGMVAGYSVLIRTNDSTPWLNWTGISEVSSSDPDAVYFHMGLQGSNGTVSEDVYLDKYNYSELRLLDSKNRSMFVIQLDSPALLTVNHNTGAHLTTEIYLNDSAEDISVELGRDIIFTGSELTGEAEKISGVKIYEG